jgi:hypothetical protein
MNNYFYSLPNSTTPSPYFNRMPKLLADLSRKGILQFRIWEGSHEAPRPVEDTPSPAEIQPAYPIDPSAECSADALAKVYAARLKAIVAAEYANWPTGRTGGEITAILVQGGLNVDILSIRPRVSDLKRERILLPTGERRRNDRGNTESVMLHRMYWNQ